MLTPIQKRVVATLAGLREEGNYLAGGAVLNARRPRISEDLDIFLDRENAVAAARRDMEALRNAGLRVQEEIFSFSFVEAVVRAAESGEATQIQWMQESAYRFFPLQPDAEFGLRLHDADLAVNKAIAAASRKKVRDIVDLAALDTGPLRLEALVWAAAESKTPMSPVKMLDNILHNATTHPLAEYRMVRSAEPVDGVRILEAIRAACERARIFCREAPVETLGKLFVSDAGEPVTPGMATLQAGAVRLHPVCEHGAWPGFVSPK
jgi:hypothetical protein